MTSETASSIAQFDRVSDLADRFDALILDLWGVVMDGSHAYPGAAECLGELHARGKTVILLSNAPRREQAVVERLAGMDIAHSLYDRIVTSGEASRLALETRSDPVAVGVIEVNGLAHAVVCRAFQHNAFRHSPRNCAPEIKAAGV